MEQIYLTLRRRVVELEKTNKSFQKESKRLNNENQRLINENQRKNQTIIASQQFQRQTKIQLDQLIAVL